MRLFPGPGPLAFVMGAWGAMEGPPEDLLELLLYLFLYVAAISLEHLVAFLVNAALRRAFGFDSEPEPQGEPIDLEELVADIVRAELDAQDLEEECES